MWGQENIDSRKNPTAGIIPTRVGTSKIRLSRSENTQDHPHACGDKRLYVGYCSHWLGSSPRVWGQETACFMFGTQDRIIPTRVGTRRSARIYLFLPTDHPHACGDKTYVISVLLFSIGSSPRVWGQDVRYVNISKRIGIIPTRVGTSDGSSTVSKAVRDHPHACGDKRVLYIVVLGKKGSSPRVWGQVSSPRLTTVLCRIIPTRVGTSKIRLSRSENTQDHPHACGDKPVFVAAER